MSYYAVDPNPGEGKLATLKRWLAVSALTPAQALVVDWLARVATAGGSVSSGEQSAVTAFATDLYAAQLVPRLVWVNPRVGDYAASKVPLIGATNETHYNFTPADYSPTTGLAGDGATKYLDTGVVPSASGMTTSSMSFGAVFKNATADAGEVIFSAFYNPDPGGIYGLDAYPYYAGGPRFTFGTSGGTATYASPTPGLLLWSHTASNDLRTYRNGLQVGATDTSSATQAVPTGSVQMFHNVQFGGAFSHARITVAFLGLALDSSDAANITTAISAMEGALGR